MLICIVSPLPVVETEKRVGVRKVRMAGPKYARYMGLWTLFSSVGTAC